MRLLFLLLLAANALLCGWYFNGSLKRDLANAGRELRVPVQVERLLLLNELHPAAEEQGDAAPDQVAELGDETGQAPSDGGFMEIDLPPPAMPDQPLSADTPLRQAAPEVTGEAIAGNEDGAGTRDEEAGDTPPPDEPEPPDATAEQQVAAADTDTPTAEDGEDAAGRPDAQQAAAEDEAAAPPETESPATDSATPEPAADAVAESTEATPPAAEPPPPDGAETQQAAATTGTDPGTEPDPGAPQLALLEGITPRELEPPPSASGTDGGATCPGYGPFLQEEQAAALERWLRRRGIVSARYRDRNRDRSYYWVYLSPPNTEELGEAIGVLKDKGITNYRLVRSGNLRNAISLGLYATRTEVETRLAPLYDSRYRPIVVPYRGTAPAYWVAARLTPEQQAAEDLDTHLAAYGQTTVPCATAGL